MSRKFSHWLFAALILGSAGLVPRATDVHFVGRHVAFVPVAQSMKFASHLDRIIIDAAAAYHIDPALVAAVIHVESNFNPYARSPVGAMGLMQLMPETARLMGVAAPYDPLQNVYGGTRYLRAMLERFGGNTMLALAAYNAGPGAVEHYGRIPPFAETASYVPKVLFHYSRYAKLL